MCENCSTYEKDGMTYRSEGVTISPTTCHQGDWIGFKESVDTDDDEAIEEVCRELEEFLKEV